MKYLRVIVCMIVIAFTACKKDKKMEQKKIKDIDITQIKWISDANYEHSPWSTTAMPMLLNFQDSLVSFNFSDRFINYEIIDDKLYLEGNYRFDISEFGENELFLENNGSVRRYIPIKKGSFNNDDKLNLEKIIQSKDWIFNNEKTKFENFMLSIYDKNDEFIKGGMYVISLYNQNLIVTLTIDGSKNRELYFIENFNEDSIVLNKLKTDDSFETVTIK